MNSSNIDITTKTRTYPHKTQDGTSKSRNCTRLRAFKRLVVSFLVLLCFLLQAISEVKMKVHYQRNLGQVNPQINSLELIISSCKSRISDEITHALFLMKEDMLYGPSTKYLSYTPSLWLSWEIKMNNYLVNMHADMDRHIEIARRDTCSGAEARELCEYMLSMWNLSYELMWLSYRWHINWGISVEQKRSRLSYIARVEE